MTNSIRFLDQRDSSDLVSYLTRARKLDDDGAVKFRAFGDILAVYVSPIFSGSLLGDGPTVLGLRTMRVNKTELDATYSISAIQERLASSGDSGGGELATGLSGQLHRRKGEIGDLGKDRESRVSPARSCRICNGGPWLHAKG